VDEDKGKNLLDQGAEPPQGAAKKGSHSAELMAGGMLLLLVVLIAMRGMCA
jgi:hypothetical protein